MKWKVYSRTWAVDKTVKCYMVGPGDVSLEKIMESEKRLGPEHRDELFAAVFPVRRSDPAHDKEQEQMANLFAKMLNAREASREDENEKAMAAVFAEKRMGV